MHDKSKCKQEIYETRHSVSITFHDKLYVNNFILSILLNNTNIHIEKYCIGI